MMTMKYDEDFCISLLIYGFYQNNGIYLNDLNNDVNNLR